MSILKQNLAVREADRWLDAYCKSSGITWEKLTAAERFQVTMLVPCTIRCFRVGDVVEVAVGERCPECGTVLQPVMSRYDYINQEDES
jgi:hypothetical protein